MLSSLPPEILDLILDHVRNERTTLKACCVVSKPWIQRTRRHLFARVEFHAPKSHIKRWKKTFPDPSNSPAHHTRYLFIYGLSVVTAADADVGGWIRTFHNVVHLHLQPFGSEGHQVSLVPFHGLSPNLRSLHLTFTSSEVLDLISSFPLLEDLALASLGSGSDAWNTPSTSPKLTGTLELRASGTIRHVARRLVGLPGLHFTKIKIVYLHEDVESIKDLVSKCSNTLKSLDIRYRAPGVFHFSFYEWSMPYRHPQM
jgi:hypothetical protein